MRVESEWFMINEAGLSRFDSKGWCVPPIHIYQPLNLARKRHIGGEFLVFIIDMANGCKFVGKLLGLSVANSNR